MVWTDAMVRGALRLAGEDRDVSYVGISTDSRTLTPGSLYLALKGPFHDGHAFVAHAVSAGARGVIVSEAVEIDNAIPMYQVPDTLVALGALASAHRHRFSGPVIAITGTNGKTSTKEMVAAVCGAKYRTHATQGNMNNLVGVPLTLLAADPTTEAFVIEAGASVPGEIEQYRVMIEPTIGVLTGVGPGHLEGFGSLDRVLTEKLTLLNRAPLAIVGTEPSVMAEQARGVAERVVVAGTEKADVMPESIRLLPSGSTAFVRGGVTVTLPFLGRHQVANAMIAWAVGEELGLTPKEVKTALEGTTLPPGRGELVRHGEMLILYDGYNANPGSFRATIALAYELRRATGRRLVFVAGSMRELGTESATWHSQILGELHQLAPDLLGVVGAFSNAEDRIDSQPGPSRVVQAPDAMSIAPAIVEQLRGDELVVLKASRGEAFEHILPLLVARAAPAD